jgi:hypothetical protein
MGAGPLSATSSILEATTEGLVPSPATAIVDLGSTTTGVDDQMGGRNPVQESQGQEGVTQPGSVTIRITIRLPGGGD